ncbi:MAG: EAL domain-containing protein [Lachnospiraceae bacterium]|nr:EAL domain-containing protein [Lachnospiraceae bacterium]
MFTWNYQYISKARLAATLEQLALEPEKGDVLIRIHTAIHLEDEAVELARFIKSIVPHASIVGTSTSAVINWGKLLLNQCMISVTQMDGGHVQSAIIPTRDPETGLPISVDDVCHTAQCRVLQENAKLILTFLAGTYLDIQRMVDRSNECQPGLQMIGGIVNVSDIGQQKECKAGFVFDENGWTSEGLLMASISGSDVESFCSYATGVQAIGEEFEITDAFGSCILELAGTDAAKEYRTGIGEVLHNRSELAELFPLVYADAPDIPVPIQYVENTSLAELYPMNDPANADMFAKRPDLKPEARKEFITTNHSVTVGRKLRRAFIYDRKIIADNRAMFGHVENFEKAETLFGYSGASRSLIYSNCAKWELSSYENSNMSGCVTDGEIVFAGGRNTLADCAFSVAVIGEKEVTQECNPYAFSKTDSLAVDNKALLSYLMEIEGFVEKNPATVAVGSLRSFVRDCEMKLLYSENDDIPNEAALNMDIKLKGYDRICIINVLDTSSMKIVFDESAIALTQRSFLGRCAEYARRRNYRMYRLEDWQVAIGAPSYTVTLRKMSQDMEHLQRELFASSEGLIAIVPTFCVINGCTVDNLKPAYNSARLTMMNKNIQFYVCDAGSFQADEESIRERYRMINLINYAIANDRIVPYYQGIHDNASGTIHHYESLMRLVDENGTVYTPYRFLEAARSYGLLYDQTSAIMIRKVFERFRNAEGVSVSINLGMRDIKNRETMEYIYDFLASVKHPENFVFEILENEDVDAYEVLESFVDRIHQLGAKISIDDFGSGYSNLQHVIGIHSDYLKIDGSIIRKCCESREAENLISLIMGWKKMGMHKIRIVAEFVENEQIQNMLMRYGIDYSQGYYFSKPTPDIAV